MNASAVLTRQGWRGEGHALDVKDRGVRKPLLIRRKNDILGVGKKKIDVAADQWWSRAFDAALSGLDAGTNAGNNTGANAGVNAKDESGQSKGKGKGVSDLHLLATGAAGAGKWTGLYAGFVRGRTLEGTIGTAGTTGTTGTTGAVGTGGEGSVPTRLELEPRRERERGVVDQGSATNGDVKKKRKAKKRADMDVDVDAMMPAAVLLPSSDDVESTKHRKHKKKKHKKSKDVGEIEGQAASSEMPARDAEPVAKPNRRDHDKEQLYDVVVEASSIPSDRPAKKKRKRKHKDRDSRDG